jgi:hypothetical protein
LTAKRQSDPQEGLCPVELLPVSFSAKQVRLTYTFNVTVNDCCKFGDKIRGNYKACPHITDISGFQNCECISILPESTARPRDCTKRRLPQRRAFAWLSSRKQNHAPVFSRSSENGFVGIHLLEHRYRGRLTALKTRDAFVRIKAVADLVWVVRLYSRWRPLSIEVQGNLCGRKAVSYKCRKGLCGKFCADGSAWNFKMQRYQTVGLGEAGAAGEAWVRWPPRSPDLTPCDFSLWGCVKEQVFVPPPSLNIDELKLRITAAIERVHRNMLDRV